MTRNQKIIFVLWVFGPLLFAGLLAFLSPGFGIKYDATLESTPITGTRLMLGIQALNAMFLYSRFSAGNKRVALAAETDSPFLAKRKTGYTSTLALILFVLPSIGIAFLYPAVIKVLETGQY